MHSLYFYSKPRTFETITVNNINSNLGIKNKNPETNLHILDTTPIVRVDEDGVNYTDLNQGVWMYGDHITWEDLRVPLTQTRQGALGKPSFDYTNVGYLFPQNDSDEVLYTIIQMPHAWKQGSDVFPHIHWKQSANQTVLFKIDYKWINIDNSVPLEFTTISLDSIRIPYTSGDIHQISECSNPISGTGKLISSLLLIKIYRDDNTYTGDVLAWDFDLHYQVNSMGSRLEYIK